MAKNKILQKNLEKVNALCEDLNNEIYKQTKKNLDQNKILQAYQGAFTDIIESYDINDWFMQPFQPIKIFTWFDNTNSNNGFQKLKSLINLLSLDNILELTKDHKVPPNNRIFLFCINRSKKLLLRK
jgi:hypothetical protein